MIWAEPFEFCIEGVNINVSRHNTQSNNVPMEVSISKIPAADGSSTIMCMKSDFKQYFAWFSLNRMSEQK